MEYTNFGYIYVRNHYSYFEYNAIKLGKTSNLSDRDSIYKTYEIKKGWFELVIEVELSDLSSVETFLLNYFSLQHIKFDAGSEFFDISIINDIPVALSKTNFIFKILNQSSIDTLLLNTSSSYFLYSKPIEYNPRDYQSDIISKSSTFFQSEDKGLLLLPCGIGKSLISLFISKSFSSILISVPTLLICNQWKKYVLNLFPSHKLLIINCFTKEYFVNLFFSYLNSDSKIIIITTYYSVSKILLRNSHFKFDINIIDEIHHLSSLDSKKYHQVFNINSFKQLGLTATLPISNIFMGKIIENRNMKWAIQNNIICDYKLQLYNITDLNIENITEEDVNSKNLYISSYITLKNILNKTIHHTIIYTNTMKNALIIIKYLNILIKNEFKELDKLYFSEYFGRMHSKIRNKVLNMFNVSTTGILVSIYSLGEGLDIPILDSVVFSENMVSNIRIIQSALRGGRKNNEESNKITKIIVPILNKIGVNKIIEYIKTEDEDVMSKIEILSIDNVDIKQDHTYIEENECMFNFSSDFKIYNVKRNNNLKIELYNILKLDNTIDNYVFYYILLLYSLKNNNTIYDILVKKNYITNNDKTKLETITTILKILKFEGCDDFKTIIYNENVLKLAEYFTINFETIKSSFKTQHKNIDGFLNIKNGYKNTKNLISIILEYGGLCLNIIDEKHLTHLITKKRYKFYNMKLCFNNFQYLETINLNLINIFLIIEKYIQNSNG